jgi:hypothetical protein
MRHPRTRFPSLVTLVVALVCCGSGFREDEVRCEDALAHLLECCPNFDRAPITCAYHYTGGCGSSTTTYPALSIRQSQCVESSSCTALRDDHVCEAAQQARSYSVYWVDADGTTYAGSPARSLHGACP